MSQPTSTTSAATTPRKSATMCERPDDCSRYACNLAHSDKRTPLCPHGDDCSNRVTCPNMHRIKTCQHVRRGKDCLNPECWFWHPEPNTTPKSKPTITTAPPAETKDECKYGNKCLTSGCPLGHPLGLLPDCPDGISCDSGTCANRHPLGWKVLAQGAPKGFSFCNFQNGTCKNKGTCERDHLVRANGQPIKNKKMPGPCTRKTCSKEKRPECTCFHIPDDLGEQLAKMVEAPDEPQTPHAMARTLAQRVLHGGATMCNMMDALKMYHGCDDLVTCCEIVMYVRSLMIWAEPEYTLATSE